MDFLQEWAENFLNGELALRESAQFIEATPDEQERMLYDYQVGCDLTFEEKCKEICAQKRIQEEEKQRQDEYVTALICSKKLLRKENIEDTQAVLLAKIAQVEKLTQDIDNEELISCIATIKLIVEKML